MVYFIANDRGEIKIGRSSDPQARLWALRGKANGRLHLLAAFVWADTYEVVCHDLFDQFRVRGEWFTASPELRSFIEFQVPNSDRPRIPPQQREAVRRWGQALPPFRVGAIGTELGTELGTEIAERQGMNNLRGSTDSGGGMGMGLKPLPSPDPGPLFTAGTIWVAETYGRRDAAAAMRRLNTPWWNALAAGDRDGVDRLLADAEILLELAYPGTQPAEDLAS